MSKPILNLDFDGVLHSYTSGWQGAHIVGDPPVPGAAAFLIAAVKAFDVHIFSSRSHQAGGKEAMRKAIYAWLCEYYLPGDDWENAPQDHLDECEGEPYAAASGIVAMLKFPDEKPSAMSPSTTVR